MDSGKVKECRSCGQGFLEDNEQIGNRVSFYLCKKSTMHAGPITRIVPEQDETVKVKECEACGQGFTEINTIIGSQVSSYVCKKGGMHHGPFRRIEYISKLLLEHQPTQQPNVQALLKKLSRSRPGQPGRLSLEGAQRPLTEDIPRITFGQVMKFVNRHKQCNDYVLTMQAMYEQYRVICSLPSTSLEFSKHFKALHACGAAGCGKSTFARKAVDNVLVDTTFKWSEIFRNNLDKSTTRGLRFCISYSVDGSPLLPGEREQPEMSIAARVAWEYIKYKATDNWASFADFWGFVSSTGETLSLKWLIENVLCTGIVSSADRIIIVNLDELNCLLGDESGAETGTPRGRSGHSREHTAKPTAPSTELDRNRAYLTSVLQALIACCVHKVAFICPFLTGTKALALEKLLSDSAIAPAPIVLPLLGAEYVREIISDLYSRATRACGQERALSVSVQLELLLNTMSGHPRFLEYFLFSMGTTDRVFQAYWRAEVFVQNVDHVNTVGKLNTQLRETVLRTVCDQLSLQYRRFEEYITKQSGPLVPLLMGYSLFGFPVLRSTMIGTTGNGGKSVSELEDAGVLFLTPIADTTELRIVIPFMWVHRMHRTFTSHADKLPYITLVDTLQCILSPTQNEELALGVLALRVYCLVAMGLKTCTPKQLYGVDVPGHDIIKLPVASGSDFSINSLKQQTTRANWKKFGDKYMKTAKIAFTNAPQAAGCDSVLLTTPITTVQNKQLLTSIRKNAQGKTTRVRFSTIADEIPKCQMPDTILVLVTDAQLIAVPSPPPFGVAIIDHATKRSFFGDDLNNRISMCLAVSHAETETTGYADGAVHGVSRKKTRAASASAAVSASSSQTVHKRKRPTTVSSVAGNSQKRSKVTK